MTPLRWIDAHCHLGDHTDRWPDPASALHEARAAGVMRVIDVGTDRATSLDALAVARANEGVWCTAGVHPHDARDGLDGIADLLYEPEVVAVGECGLDYHYDHSPRDVQRRVFAEQIALARERDLALVVHTREAWEDTFEVLRTEGVPDRTVIHCFTGGPREAERCLELGAHLSFSGIVTFKNAPEVREALVRCPADRLLVETDAPFLAPVPHRGAPNRPAWVSVVGEAIAEVRGVSVAEVADVTWRNAAQVFRLDSPD